MPLKVSANVAINFSPKVPKDNAGTLVELIKASEDVAKYARAYLADGDFDLARQLLNAKMRLNVLGTKQALPQMMAKIAGSYQPLTEEERTAASDSLAVRDLKQKEADG